MSLNSQAITPHEGLQKLIGMPLTYSGLGVNQKIVNAVTAPKNNTKLTTDLSGNASIPLTPNKVLYGPIYIHHKFKTVPNVNIGTDQIAEMFTHKLLTELKMSVGGHTMTQNISLLGVVCHVINRYETDVSGKKSGAYEHFFVGSDRIDLNQNTQDVENQFRNVFINLGNEFSVLYEIISLPFFNRDSGKNFIFPTNLFNLNFEWKYISTDPSYSLTYIKTGPTFGFEIINCELIYNLVNIDEKYDISLKQAYLSTGIILKSSDYIHSFEEFSSGLTTISTKTEFSWDSVPLGIWLLLIPTEYRTKTQADERSIYRKAWEQLKDVNISINGNNYIFYDTVETYSKRMEMYNVLNDSLPYNCVDVRDFLSDEGAGGIIHIPQKYLKDLKVSYAFPFTFKYNLKFNQPLPRSLEVHTVAKFNLYY